LACLQEGRNGWEKAGKADDLKVWTGRKGRRNTSESQGIRGVSPENARERKKYSVTGKEGRAVFEVRRREINRKTRRERAWKFPGEGGKRRSRGAAKGSLL